MALALELLERFPIDKWPAGVVVMADAAFRTSEFLQGTCELGFEKVLVGMRCKRRLVNGRKLAQLSRKGKAVRLHDLPERQLYASWCAVKRSEAMRRFFIVATFAASGRWLTKRYRKRWLIEAFFHSVKHDFGLKEARLRTHDGMKLWIFFTCLAYGLASLEWASRAAAKTTLEDLAQELLQELLTEYCLVVLMTACQNLSWQRNTDYD